MLVFLLNYLIAAHDGSVAILYRLEILVLNIHVLTELRVGRGHNQSVEDILHVCITLVVCLVKLHILLIVFFLVGLVKDAENLLKAIVDLSAQERYLYDDAVMGKAIDKRVRQALGHLMPLVVVGFVVDIEYRHVDVPHPVSENIHSHHRDAVGRAQLLLHHIFLVGILGTEILPEAQGLRVKPRLLQLNENKTH